MRIRSIFTVLCILLAVNASSLNIINQSHKASLHPVIPGFWINCSGVLSTDIENWWYRVNDGTFESVTKVIPISSLSRVSIENLKLSPGGNSITFYYRNNNAGGVIEKAVITVNFINPTFEIVPPVLLGTSAMKTTGNFFVTDVNGKITINYKIIPVSIDPNETHPLEYSFDYAYYKFPEESSWHSVKIGVPIVLDKLAKEGFNQLLVKIPESKWTKIEDFKTYTVNFFYSYFDLDPLFVNNEIWVSDIMLPFTGHPSGGWFTGKGIMSNSNFFNPKQAGVGSYTITYTYPYENVEITSSKNIKVFSYGFSVSGPKSVCLNSSSLYYVYPVNNDFSYSWDTQGNQFTFTPGKDSIIVRWKIKPPVFNTTVAVKCTATHKNRPDIQFRDTIYVHIKDNKALDPAELFFGDINKTFVVCTDTSAYYYNWSRDDREPVRSGLYYHQFEAVGKKYMVDMVTREDCHTRMEILYNDANGYSDIIVPVAKTFMEEEMQAAEELILYPNPVNDHINLTFKPAEESRIVRIYNSSFQKIFEDIIGGGTSNLLVDTSVFSCGRYVVQLLSGAGITTSQFIKIN